MKVNVILKSCLLKAKCFWIILVGAQCDKISCLRIMHACVCMHVAHIEAELHVMHTSAYVGMCKCKNCLNRKEEIMPLSLVSLCLITQHYRSQTMTSFRCPKRFS